MNSVYESKCCSSVVTRRFRCLLVDEGQEERTEQDDAGVTLVILVSFMVSVVRRSWTKGWGKGLEISRPGLKESGVTGEVRG